MSKLLHTSLLSKTIIIWTVISLWSELLFTRDFYLKYGLYIFICVKNKLLKVSCGSENYLKVTVLLMLM